MPMAAATPEIQVSAMFRADPESPAWRWVHCLTFSVEILNQLHFPRPYQWMKYAIGVVVGAYGELSSSVDSQQDVIGRNDLPSETIDLYYHITDEERQRMFPIDLDIGSPAVTSTSLSTRRVEFRNKVMERDGACVLTGAGLHSCQAALLVAHAKGNDYIANYTRHRSRVENDVIEDIDDVRNGILINSTAHHSFGRHTAFLMTPNFAMTTADIHPDLPPEEICCTAHRFILGPAHDLDLGDRTLHSGCRVQMPPSGSDDRSNWPPDILFDAVYANAVLLHFAAPGLQGRCSSMEIYLLPWRSHKYKASRLPRDEFKSEPTGNRRRTNKKMNVIIPSVSVMNPTTMKTPWTPWTSSWYCHTSRCHQRE
ncbi:hypothetical protein JVU11DRAFT_9697 [Chiua virens]|nr:hypothetical protein JVU11DRAFT_9697 [Chiua virens]